MRALFLLLALSCITLGADWPPVKYIEVRAYYYNHIGQPDFPITQRGKLNPTVQNKGGALLSKKQVARLLSTLNTKRYSSLIPGCYTPRHGFVFYDAAGKIVASYEICLECKLQSSIPEGVAPRTDFQDIADLVVELKLSLGPRFKDLAAFREEYAPYAQMTSPFKEEPVANAAAGPAVVDEPVKITSADVAGIQVPAENFALWLAKNPQDYSGTYSYREVYEPNPTEPSVTTLKIVAAQEDSKWLINGTSEWSQGSSRRVRVYWDVPLETSSPARFGYEIFVRYTPPNSKPVHGILSNGRFYPREEAPEPAAKKMR